MPMRINADHALILNLVSTGIIILDRREIIDHALITADHEPLRRFWVVNSPVSSFPGHLIYFHLPVFSLCLFFFFSFLCLCLGIVLVCLKPKSIETFTNTTIQLTAPTAPAITRSKVAKTAELADRWARVNLTGRDQRSRGMFYEWPFVTLVRDVRSSNTRELTTSGDENIIFLFFFKYTSKWS